MSRNTSDNLAASAITFHESVSVPQQGYLHQKENTRMICS
ncbi:hypothetical protein CSPAE12_03710 [Colletotrichum incanum]|nr:hypothetical protein CSPAE12_03710 [Colletotrichum incanum]